jgi:hypothetical protein
MRVHAIVTFSICAWGLQGNAAYRWNESSGQLSLQSFTRPYHNLNVPVLFYHESWYS